MVKQNGMTKEGRSETKTMVEGENSLNIATLRIVVYKIGDTGPGGGTVFYADDTGAYKEVIASTSNATNLSTAYTNAENYSGEEGTTDWFLPNKHELYEIYTARASNTTLQNKIADNTYWSTTSADYITGSSADRDFFPNETSKFIDGTTEVWTHNFTADDPDKTTISGASFSVLYIRCYNPVSYSIGDTGPGGGRIFWVDGGAYREISSVLTNSHWFGANSNAEAHTGGNKSDWYLPDVYELKAVYQQREKIDMSTEAGDLFWSSSEAQPQSGYDYAWGQGSDGSQYGGDKTAIFGVRAIRAFNTSSL